MATDMTPILLLAGAAVGGYLLYENWDTLFPPTTAAAAAGTSPPAGTTTQTQVNGPTQSSQPTQSQINNPPVVTAPVVTAPVVTAPVVTAPSSSSIVTTLFGQPTASDSSNEAAFQALIDNGTVTPAQLQAYYNQVAALFSANGINPASIGYYVYELANGSMTMPQVTAQIDKNAGVSGFFGMGAINRIPMSLIHRGYGR
jgi:hypothetical protein